MRHVWYALLYRCTARAWLTGLRYVGGGEEQRAAAWVDVHARRVQPAIGVRRPARAPPCTTMHRMPGRHSGARRGCSSGHGHAHRRVPHTHETWQRVPWPPLPSIACEPAGLRHAERLCAVSKRASSRRVHGAHGVHGDGRSCCEQQASVHAMAHLDVMLPSMLHIVTCMHARTPPMQQQQQRSGSSNPLRSTHNHANFHATARAHLISR